MLPELSNRRLFVTGTNTEVGKTFYACHLLRELEAAGYRTTAIKPVATEALHTADGDRNQDALNLMAAMTEDMPYEHINPALFTPPIAPHIAAQEVGVRLSVKDIAAACQPALSTPADVCVIEGAGGWLVPLNDKEILADLAEELNAGIIVVVAMQLGCLNHALLTVADIQRRGLPLVGWVANTLQKPMPYLTENIDTLKQAIDAPLLASL